MKAQEHLQSWLRSIRIFLLIPVVATRSVQSLQESVLAERAAAQADLAAARERLEEMRDVRVREREEFLAECEAERKELAAERKALGDAKEQVCLAEAELDVRIAQHEAKVKVRNSGGLRSSLGFVVVSRVLVSLYVEGLRSARSKNHVTRSRFGPLTTGVHS